MIVFACVVFPYVFVGSIFCIVFTPIGNDGELTTGEAVALAITWPLLIVGGIVAALVHTPRVLLSAARYVPRLLGTVARNTSSAYRKLFTPSKAPAKLPKATALRPNLTDPRDRPTKGMLGPRGGRWPV